MKPKKKQGCWKWTLSQWWFYLTVLIVFYLNFVKNQIYDVLFAFGLVVGSFISLLFFITFLRFIYLGILRINKTNSLSSFPSISSSS